MRYIFLFFISTQVLFAQTIWTGESIIFTKPRNANASLPANQDRITSNVWLTRGVENVLYNAVAQSSAPIDGFDSPEDTMWAEGTTANINELTFTDFKSAAPKNSNNSYKVKSMVGKNYVLHLITDDIYIDLKILSWNTRQQGAGFSYERSTDPNLSTNDFSGQKLKLSPNPSVDYLQVLGLTKTTKYSIYSILGVVVKTGEVSNSQKIPTQSLINGFYLLKLEGGNTFKFLKK